MVSFLGLMDTIKLKPKQTSQPASTSGGNKDLAMTQYMLKMLTILTNILVGNLIALQASQAKKGQQLDVRSYAEQLVCCFTEPACKEIRARLNSLSSVIPASTA
mmetsp:Transcript_44562/g.59130  ORF Transcript_44562/g.59130 Transcript_44562/m.59130 type:complete len:104 (+) Transcript_44562:571-882(+)